MKFKFKMFAVAAAMATLAGAAHADLTSGTTVTNGSFTLVAWNTVTRDWYMRDLGYLMNDFLPTGVNAIAADGGPATGDKSTPGLIIAGTAGPGVTVKSNFSDSAFSTWFGGQTASDVRWWAGSYDMTSVSGTGTTRRIISTSGNAAETFTNAQLDTYNGTGAGAGLFSYFGTGTLSKTGTAMGPLADNGFGAGIDPVAVGTGASLFFATRTAFTGASSTIITPNNYGGSTLTLLSSGEVTYVTSPVPLPATVWMMGAGLMAVGGLVRRRRAAAAEQA